MSTSSSQSTGPRSAFGMLLLLETALVICWSGGFIGMRFAVDYAPVFLILLWRNLLSGLILLPVAILRGPAMQWRDIRAQILLGALAMGLYIAVFTIAMDLGVPTGVVALIADMLPLAVALLSWPILNERLVRAQWIGTFLGVAGVLVASGASLQMASDVSRWAYGLPVLGTLALACATILMKRSPSLKMPSYQAICIQCLSASAIFALLAWHDGGVAPIIEPHFIAGITWLVFVATIGSGSLYFIAIRRSSPARVTAVLYLSPPLTMVWAWAVFHEPLTWGMAAGLLLSLAGIVVFARAKG